jgi:serine/threonine protein kinase
VKKNDIIGGYRVTTEPTNDGGGKCVWAFAEKDGQEYFLKQFLEPKRPKPGSTAGEVSRRLRLEECAEFEDRHRTIMSRLRHDASGAGNLVLAVDFFHEGMTYYKVTERIDTSTLEKFQSLSPRQKRVLLRTLGFSLQVLHDIDVVHGDLKPANVLIQRKGDNTFYTAKLIDFDDSYLSGRPPERDTITGDSFYGAPEWRRYVQGDEDVPAEHLTTGVDMFALGLMTHYYVTGRIPGYDDRFHSPADAVKAGTALRLDHRLTSSMQGLIRAMLSRAPGARPRTAAFLNALKDPEICTLNRKHRPKPREEKKGSSGRSDGGALAEVAARTSRLRTNMGDGRGSEREAEPERGRVPEKGAGKSGGGTSSADAERVSRVRINLGDRRA